MKLNLKQVLNGFLSIGSINSNNAAITAAVEDSLSKSGAGSNAMQSDLDMNGHKILNADIDASVDPSDITDAVNLAVPSVVASQLSAVVPPAAASAAALAVSAATPGIVASARSGLVKTVNGVSPDASGNATVATGGTGSPPTTDASQLVSGTLADARLSSTAAKTSLGYTPLNPANNLSELIPATARSNLGLGPLATTSIVPTTSLPAFKGDVTNATDGTMTLTKSAASRSNLGVPSTVDGWPVVNDNIVLKHVFNIVSLYGADPTGTTDCTAIIQQAVNDLANRAIGGTLYFPQGRYLINGAVSLPANITIMGSGKYGTRLIAGSGGNAIFQFLNSTSSRVAANINIRDLEIYANTSGTVFLKLVFCANVILTDLLWNGVAIVINADRVQFIRESHCYNTTGGASGSYPAGVTKFYSSTATDYSSHIYRDGRTNFNNGAGFSAIVVNEYTRCVDTVVTRDHCNDANVSSVNAAGHVYHAFYGDCQGCKIVDCFNGAAAKHVLFDRDQRNTSNTQYPSFCGVINCDFDYPQSQTILVNGGTYLTFQGGRYTAYTTSPANVIGVLIQQNANYIKVDGIVIQGFNSSSGCNGVVDASGGKGISITGCMIDTCSTGVGFTQTTNTSCGIVGNIFTNCPANYAFNPGSGGNTNKVRSNMGATVDTF